MADLSVAGRIYQNGKLVAGTLHVDTATGRIEKIAKTAKLANHLDMGTKAILPGFLDIHVHFRDPGATQKEDFHTGTVSAAHGGVTGVVDMPNTAPPTTNPRAVDEKHALAKSKAVVDYGFWAGATWYTDGLPDTLEGCVGVKTYLGATTGDLLLEEQERLPGVLEAAGAAGKPVALHAEAQRILTDLRRTEQTLVDHDQARPPLAEVESIYDAMKALARVKSKPRIHIAHCASVEALQAATQAKFSTGVCPHHMLLDTSMFDEAPNQAFGKMNPPLRSAESRKAMWAAFAAGKFPVVESDHAPHTIAEKAGAFHQAPSGVPGVETMGPLLLAKAMAGDVDLSIVVDALSSGPAHVVGLADRGTLAPGMRADFQVIDLEAVAPIDGGALHSKCGWSPYDGMDAVFPEHVYLAGQPVIEDKTLVAAPGTGQPFHG